MAYFPELDTYQCEDDNGRMHYFLIQFDGDGNWEYGHIDHNTEMMFDLTEDWLVEDIQRWVDDIIQDSSSDDFDRWYDALKDNNEN